MHLSSKCNESESARFPSPEAECHGGAPARHSGAIHSGVRCSGIRLMAWTGLLLFSLVFLGNCTARTLGYRTAAPLALAGAETSCKPVARSSQWQALWDMYRIFDADFDDYSFQSGRTYRYSMEDTWQDWAINATVGFLTTVTRHTVVLQQCDAEVVVRTAEEIEKQVSDALAKHLKAEGVTRAHLRQPIFILKGGSSVQGRIVQITPTELVLEIERQATDEEGAATDSDSGSEEASSAKQGPATGDRISLKSGGVLEGRVVTQDVASMTIEIARGEDAGKTRKISKSDIAQVQFGVVLDESQVEKEQIRIVRKDIERITVPR
jgi:exosome complex RNA-binding protein Csl4